MSLVGPGALGYSVGYQLYTRDPALKPGQWGLEDSLPLPPPTITTLPLDKEDGPSSTSKPLTSSGTSIGSRRHRASLCSGGGGGRGVIIMLLAAH